MASGSIFLLPNIRDLNDVTNVNPIFRVSTFQTKLMEEGINPETYLKLLRVLVLDYGFSVSTAMTVLSEMTNNTVGDAEKYFKRFVFTTGRKIGYIYDTSLPENNIKSLSFVPKRISYDGVQKTGTPIRGADQYFPYGLIRFNYVIPNPQAPEAFDLQNLVSYSEAIDANMLLSDHNKLEHFGIFPNGIKMIVSDRMEPDKREGMKVKLTEELSSKRFKSNTETRFQKLFPHQDQIPQTFHGLYDIPEWTSLMLARREKRIKWIIHKSLRDWRATKIAMKRRSMFEAGYVSAQFNLTTGQWDLPDVMNTSYLQNWIRETSIGIFDSEVLNPVYQEVINRMSDIVHTNYPVTVDEIGNYLLDVFDMIWSEDNSDQKNNHYFQHLTSLLQRYCIRDSPRYLELWLKVNGIIDVTPRPPTQNQFGLNPIVPPHTMETLQDLAEKAISQSTDPQFSTRIVQIFQVARDLQSNSGNKLLVEITDSVLTDCLSSYLDLKAELLQSDRMMALDRGDPVGAFDEIVEKMIKIILIDMVISNVANYDVANLGGWNEVKVDGPTITPALYYGFVDNLLPVELAYGYIPPDYVQRMRKLNPTSPLFAGIAKSIEDLGKNHGRGTPLTMESLFTRDGQIQAQVGFSIFHAVLMKSLSPMIQNAVRHPDILLDEISKLEGKLTLLFSVSQISQSTSFEIYTQEEREMVDMMIALEGMKIGTPSKNLTFSFLSKRERVVTYSNDSPTIDIIPTVEATLHRTSLYRFSVYFINYEGLRSLSGSTERGQLLLARMSDNMSERLSIKIPAKQSGYLNCLVESLMKNGTVFATGEMPSVRVEYKRRCVRSKTEFSEFDGTTRPYKHITLEGGVIKSALKGNPDNRVAKWSLEPLVLLTERAHGKLNEVIGTFNNFTSILQYCLLMHMGENFSDQNSPWYYKKMWYNANHLSIEGLKKAIFISSDPYKRLVQYKQLDMKTQEEIDQRTQKTTLKLYKRLFMLNEFNEYFNELAQNKLKIHLDVTTVDFRTMSEPVIEGFYVRRDSVSIAIEGILKQVSYLGALNFCSNVLNMMAEMRRGQAPVTFPDVFNGSNHFDATTTFLIDCVSELAGRTTNMIANLSFEKSSADTNEDMMESSALPLKKFIAASWYQLNARSPDIPNNIPTFDVAREILSVGHPIDSDVAEVNTVRKEMITLFCPLVTRRFYHNRYKNSLLHKQIEGGKSLTEVDYVGYNSGDMLMPYFYSLTDYNGHDLKAIPRTRQETYDWAMNGKIFLRFGDSRSYISEAVQIEQDEREKKISQLFDQFVSSINTVTHTANNYDLYQIILLCREYNSLLL